MLHIGTLEHAAEAMTKRKHAQICSDEPMLCIKLADAEPLEADHTVVRMFSTVARGLPFDAQDCCAAIPACWDLSNLLIDGQRVQRPVVVAWLNCAYQHAFDSPFLHQQDSPAHSMERLYKLLAFADAVGSTKGLLKACMSQLDQLELHAQLGPQQLALSTDGRGYLFDGSERPHLVQAAAGTAFIVNTPAASEGAKQAFIQQAASQTEQLLWMAYKLQLVPLQCRLRRFVCGQVQFGGSIFGTTVILHTLFSQRVLDAAIGPSADQAACEAWMRCEVVQRYALACGPFTKQLLVPTDLTEQQKQPIEFNAILAQDFMGTAKGTIVPVKLDLLTRGKVQIGSNTYSAQLSLSISTG